MKDESMETSSTSWKELENVKSCVFLSANPEIFQHGKAERERGGELCTGKRAILDF